MATLHANCLPWFAVHVRSRHEKLVNLVLQNKGYEVFLPLFRRSSNDTRTVRLPLFPGYLFCRLDVCQRLPILMTSGVIGIVGDGVSPIPVTDAEIRDVRVLVESGLNVRPHALHTGQRVIVERGPLKGLTGIYVGSKNVSRLIVSLTLLQRAVAVEIDSDWIRPVEFRREATSERRLLARKLAG